ncbi:MAG: TylF/MycF family methyltransferase [Chloroflexota bacterium]|nr:TylF/MycF family methyltransferase [Chloroflexota bacterium]
MKRILPNLIYGELEHQPFDLEARANGRDWPVAYGAHTMIGLKRLDNLQHCIEDVLAKSVPGDFIETGVWRGGAVIFMRAVLKAYNIQDRTVWAADSFRGLPEPKADAYPADEGDRLFTYSELAVSLGEVQANFARYGLLDDQVRFLEGWFSDTLPRAPIDRLAIARLDGDMYESTIDGLTHLYPKLSKGGYLIVDDFGWGEACRQAVHDYRTAHGISERLVDIDWTGVYWRKDS